MSGKARKESAMKYFNIYTLELPREFTVCPRVSSIGNHTDCPVMERQLVNGLQICLRFHSNIERIGMTINDKEYEAGFPHLIIKRHGELHQLSEACNADSFYFTYEMDNCPNIPEDLVVREVKLSKAINKRIHSILALIENSCDYGVFDIIDSLCQQLLVELMVLSADDMSITEEGAKIRKVTSYLQVHYTEPLNFTEIARHFGLSARSFYRHWERFHKKSPAKYVAELKLIEAERLLQETELSIEQISEQLNYSSSAYFVNFFKKAFKLTPFQYRKKNILAEN
jgi:AraC-like DNA-binding protein